MKAKQTVTAGIKFEFSNHEVLLRALKVALSQKMLKDF